jgi:small subunit ribosomal protein S1
MNMKIKARFVPSVAEEFANTEDFQNLLDTVAINIKEGSVVRGKVINVGSEVVVIDVGLKNEGRIAISEFRNHLPSVGDMVDVFVDKLESRHGGTILSREKAMREESWMKLEASHLNGDLVDGVIFGRVKGGFTVDVSGVVAFLPGSQVDVRPIKDIEPLMNIVQPFQILKMDRKLGNIVVSRRAILEESRSEARDEMLSTMKEGMVLEGVVKNIVNYGAFIDLGMCDGLLHLIDISWNRINHPSEVLHVGQKINVMVIKYNDEKKRISLGMKQLEANPWKDYDTKYPVGTVVKGKVVDFADYGAFVQLDGEEVEGLVYYSEISWAKTNQNPKKLLSVGQEVQCKVLEVDIDKHRISLSIKQCIDNPWTQFAKDNPVGSIIKGEIRNIADFGMFVAIGSDIDGMVRDSDIAKGISGPDALKKYSKGDVVECKVLAIDTEKEKVSLGIKQLQSGEDEEPYVADVAEAAGDLAAYKKGDVHTCTVAIIEADGVTVTIGDDVVGFVKKTDLSSDKAGQKADKFAIGDRFDAKVLSVSKQKNLVNLSVKALEMEEREKAIKEYGSADSGASLGDILGAALKNSN